MRMTQEKILIYLKKLKPELEREGIEKLAIFGSFATDKQNIYSDIDIALKKKSNFLHEYTAYDYFNLLAKIKSKIRENLHLQSDIFDLDSDSSFRAEIEKELIYV